MAAQLYQWWSEDAATTVHRKLGSREWDQDQNRTITFKDPPVVNYLSIQATPYKGSTDSENNAKEQEPKHNPVKEIEVSNYNRSM